jgi:hypothetical protein
LFFLSLEFIIIIYCFSVIKAAGTPYRFVPSQNQHYFRCMLHIYRAFQVVYNIYTHNTPAGLDLAQYSMYILFIFRYNGMLVTFTVVSFVTKFQSHVLSACRLGWASVAIISDT